MSNPATRVTHITVVTRDDVDVHVINCLPGRLTGVKADVIAVGLQLGVELALNLIDQGQHVCPLLVSSLPPGSDHSSRHHQGMPWADWETIGNDECRPVRCDPLRSRNLHKWRVTVGHLGSDIGLWVDAGASAFLWGFENSVEVPFENSRL